MKFGIKNRLHDNCSERYGAGGLVFFINVVWMQVCICLDCVYVLQLSIGLDRFNLFVLWDFYN